MTCSHHLPALLRRYNESPIHTYKFVPDLSTFGTPPCVDQMYRLTAAGAPISAPAILDGSTLLASSVGVRDDCLHLISDDLDCLWHETLPGTLTPAALERWASLQDVPLHC